jgi:hypothetical protein
LRTGDASVNLNSNHFDGEGGNVMADYLAAEALREHVRALAEGIGPRPAGHPEEAAARHYIQDVLGAAGVREAEQLRFPAPDTWGYALIIPTLLALAGNALGALGRLGKVMGGTWALAGAYALWRATGGNRQPFAALAPRRDSATLIVRLAPTGAVRRRAVLIGHTDTNKHRLTFEPRYKRLLLASTTAGIVAAAANGVAQLGQGIGIGGKTAQRWSLLGLLAGLAVELADETGDYVDGGNDNASAVACVLGLGRHLLAHPLEHTEVWLAFTGAEEVGCLGTHALLDAYGRELSDAWFIDFEMVGARRISYVTRHSGFSYFSAYAPDADSLALAATTARQHPDLNVTGRPMVIVEEVGSLRGRGYRGVCVAGAGEDGWLANWHQRSDTFANVDPAGLERAARFALAMLQGLDHDVSR